MFWILQRFQAASNYPSRQRQPENKFTNFPKPHPITPRPPKKAA
ncbi:hypothetical protein [Kingella sp. (in: b-proteobacteria)]|nr:hypothetical protein [Kingella sp. (in: b-proteobacteria)]MDO4658157.1 hypothetical protein [Kingella sp. (in: b-proteobacteria)]